MALFEGKIPIIKRNLNEGWLGEEGEMRGGCEPRDFLVDPEPLMMQGDSPAGMQLIPDADWDTYYDTVHAQGALLYQKFLRDPFLNLDQNGHGYCWAYSVASAVMLDRLRQNVTPVRLNPHATAAIIKGGRDQGGWCGLSYKFGDEHGWAVEGNGEGQWPRHSRDLRNDTPALRANMALHKTVEGWYDLGKREYDQKLNKRQLVTLGLTGFPGAVDYNRFAHSMGFIGVVRLEAGHWSPMVLNSWKGWGYKGLGVLENMWPDNAVAVRSTTPSVT